MPTAPTVPAGTKDCGITGALSGWPTTTISPPGAYACLVDALAAGTPAQMRAIVAGDHPSGRQTADGYDVPARRVTTWLVVGVREVRETVDLTDDGGTATTRTCTGLTEAAVGSPPEATGCS
ncbi:hypothetical protein KSP35_23015 [Aquihabitans sp. G128]|uniref:hypothetical protein n=1 Tax=Aquihabitans sp. G128 TaxID=2849779 RepID=UPI001C2158F5|nr:hypothetical protein [Aquihabitans sp. G128]QXC61145.1 hypothetical protein KSP35_23015 [Aquihabitans sp. G128]